MAPEPEVVPAPEPEPLPVESGYVDEKNLQELDILEEIPAEVLTSEQISNLHVIGGKDKEETSGRKPGSLLLCR